MNIDVIRCLFPFTSCRWSLLSSFVGMLMLLDVFFLFTLCRWSLLSNFVGMLMLLDVCFYLHNAVVYCYLAL